jgi:hypothetical protein
VVLGNAVFEAEVLKALHLSVEPGELLLDMLCLGRERLRRLCLANTSKKMI